MRERFSDPLLALGAGALLALMIAINSLLASYNSPLLASWLAHGMGAITAWLLPRALIGQDASLGLFGRSARCPDGGAGRHYGQQPAGAFRQPGADAHRSGFVRHARRQLRLDWLA